MTLTHVQHSSKALATLVSHLTEYFPAPDDVEPRGPIGPIVRKALERFGPHPEPWSWAALNSHPLPPRVAFSVVLARTLVDQVESLQMLSQALPSPAGESVLAYSSTLISRFIDDCGNGVIVLHFPKHGPWPPSGDEPRPIGPEELVMIGAHLANAGAVHPEFGAGGLKLMDLGLERLAGLSVQG